MKESISPLLKNILADKRKEVHERKELVPLKKLEKSIHFTAPVVSLKKYLLREDMAGIIAEVKRRSPSAGELHPYLSVPDLSVGYMQAGASALSILTDAKYFGGKGEDVTAARQANFCPILRKEFIIDEYQIIEARSLGADVILLIASCLTLQEMKRFSSLAQSLGLEVLVEVHSEEELRQVLEYSSLVGVNNRNLDTLVTSVDVCRRLASLIPPEVICVAESGLRDAEIVVELRQAGYRGFLIGEHFLTNHEPAASCRKMVEKIKHLTKVRSK
jgi:indole-3-glycerol phosphate synthase